jgi:hypothetical protein
MTVPGGKAGKSPRLPGGLDSSRAATGIPTSTTDVGDSSLQQASAAPTVGQRRRGSRRRDVAAPEAAAPAAKDTNAIARGCSSLTCERT